MCIPLKLKGVLPTEIIVIRELLQQSRARVPSQGNHDGQADNTYWTIIRITCRRSKCTHVACDLPQLIHYQIMKYLPIGNYIARRGAGAAAAEEEEAPKVD